MFTFHRIAIHSEYNCANCLHSTLFVVNRLIISDLWSVDTICTYLHAPALVYTHLHFVYTHLHASTLICTRLHSSTRIYTYLHKCLLPSAFLCFCRHRHIYKRVQPMALYTYEGEAFLLLRKKFCSPYVGLRCWRDCLNQCVLVCR